MSFNRLSRFILLLFIQSFMQEWEQTAVFFSGERQIKVRDLHIWFRDREKYENVFYETINSNKNMRSCVYVVHTVQASARSII